jgi:hypothetical protein
MNIKWLARLRNKTNQQILVSSEAILVSSAKRKSKIEAILNKSKSRKKTKPVGKSIKMLLITFSIILEHLWTLNPRSSLKRNLSKVRCLLTLEEEKQKRQASQPKRKQNEYLGRDEKVEADKFFKMRDENEQLRKQMEILHTDLKRMNVAVEKTKKDIIVERRLGDRKVIHMDGGFDVEVETLKMENEKLSDKNKKMTVIIQGLQGQQKSKSLNPRKNLINAKNTFDKQNATNEYLHCINLLREQLKNSENEVKRLHGALNGPNRYAKNAGEYTKDVNFNLKIRLRINQNSFVRSKRNMKRLSYKMKPKSRSLNIRRKVLMNILAVIMKKEEKI